jgi:hypothetical protein
MESIEIGKQITAASKQIKDTFEKSMMLVIALNFVIVMGISYIWSLINSL